MYLDLTDILRAPGTSVQKPIDTAPASLDDIELKSPLEGWVKATNARQNVVISGEASTTIVQECGRCLEAFDQPIEVTLEAVAPVSFFLSRLNGTVESDEHETQNELTADELAALFDAHTLDVFELIRQAIVLQTPIAPLCSPDCPGLPEAANFQEERDERWGALANWQRTAPGDSDASIDNRN
jgi:uncharacterized protein